jgi:hypothetical protein
MICLVWHPATSQQHKCKVGFDEDADIVCHPSVNTNTCGSTPYIEFVATVDYSRKPCASPVSFHPSNLAYELCFLKFEEDMLAVSNCRARRRIYIESLQNLSGMLTASVAGADILKGGIGFKCIDCFLPYPMT